MENLVKHQCPTCGREWSAPMSMAERYIDEEDAFCPECFSLGEVVGRRPRRRGLGLGIGPGRGRAAPRGSRAFAPKGGRGRMGGPKAAGPGGGCYCPSCGRTAQHRVGVPCYASHCPDCGAKMVREEGAYSLEQALTERSVTEFRAKLTETVKRASNNPDLLEELGQLRITLDEALSDSDWAKVGTVLGLLWYRLDRLVGVMDGIGRDTTAIRSNTGRG